MVVDRQHLSTNGPAANLLDTSTKKAKPAAPVNIYRPPPLRRRTEALAISNCDSSPGVITEPKTEKVSRPAKQRRPDIQVYVPRAKRILTPSESNLKVTNTVVPDPSRNRTLTSPKKQVVGSLAKQRCEKGIQDSSPRIVPPTSNTEILQLTDTEKSLRITGLNNAEASVPSVKVIDSCLPEFPIKSSSSNLKNEATLENRKVSAILSDTDSSKIIHNHVSRLEENQPPCLTSVDETSNPTKVFKNVIVISETVGSREREHPVVNECRTNVLYTGGGCSSDSAVGSADNKECDLVQNTCDVCHTTRELCQCSGYGQDVILREDLDLCSVESYLSAGIGDEISIEDRKYGLRMDTGMGTDQASEQQFSENIIDDTESEVERRRNEQNLEIQSVLLAEISDKTQCAEDCIVGDEESAKLENAPCENSISDMLISDPHCESSETHLLSSRCEAEAEQSNETSPTSATSLENRCEAVPSSAEISSPIRSSTPVTLNPDECSWEMMFDDNGDCLDPKLMEELTNAVGSVKIEKPKSDYNSYQNRPEILIDPGDEFSHVVEIYNFPASLKTEDLVAIFSPYKNGGFEIKWVDNTHALGVFSSSLIAAEVLATEHPFVKTRPLREASHESRMKARRSAEFLQPYRVRPETCAALARRLVTGALGVKLNTSREEREAERRLLREAREKKRLAAKQRDEIWEGPLPAN